MNIYTPYTYLIGWTQHNLWYYGVRYAKNCHPADLWVTYWTSSKEVAKTRKIYGEPNIIQIRKTFQCSDSARKHECRVLKRMRVVKKVEWLNKHNGIAFDPTIMPRGKSHWTNQVSDAATRHRVRMCGDVNPNNLIEVKQTKSKRMRGPENPVNNAKVREKIKKTLTGYKSPRVICGNCSRDIGLGIYTRYHGNKCKVKLPEINSH